MGARYEDLDRPTEHVGAVLEETAFHPGRSARNHLGSWPPQGGIRRPASTRSWPRSASRDAADRRVKGYSMGMRQRLAIAAALLGDPQVLILDEPTNGLDPPGISWMRGLLRDQARRGRAVLVSSHLLAEVAQSVDDVVVIAKGRAARPGHAGAGARAATAGPRPRCARTTRSGSPPRSSAAGTRSSARRRAGRAGRGAGGRWARSRWRSRWPCPASRRGRARWRPRSSS